MNRALSLFLSLSLPPSPLPLSLSPLRSLSLCASPASVWSVIRQTPFCLVPTFFPTVSSTDRRSSTRFTRFKDRLMSRPCVITDTFNYWWWGEAGGRKMASIPVRDEREGAHMQDWCVFSYRLFLFFPSLQLSRGLWECVRSLGFNLERRKTGNSFGFSVPSSDPVFLVSTLSSSLNLNPVPCRAHIAALFSWFRNATDLQMQLCHTFTPEGDRCFYLFYFCLSSFTQPLAAIAYLIKRGTRVLWQLSQYTGQFSRYSWWGGSGGEMRWSGGEMRWGINGRIF